MRTLLGTRTREGGQLARVRHALDADADRPLAYLAMSNLLRLYAFRISLSAWDFLLAGVAVLLAATATVIFEAVKTARANPVDSLRYE